MDLNGTGYSFNGPGKSRTVINTLRTSHIDPVRCLAVNQSQAQIVKLVVVYRVCSDSVENEGAFVMNDGVLRTFEPRMKEHANRATGSLSGRTCKQVRNQRTNLTGVEIMGEK